MNHYRQNPFGDPVVVASTRATRPFNTALPRPTAVNIPAHDPDCPFCTGNEHMTPPEVDALRPMEHSTPDTPGWQVRVVPNKYPAFTPHPDTPVTDTWAGDFPVAPFPGMPGTERPAAGRHEVAVHSPDHFATLSRLAPTDLASAVRMWQRRTRSHRDEGWTVSVVTVNEGREAGASQQHPHAQIFALDTIPPAISRELDSVDAWTRGEGDGTDRDQASPPDLIDQTVRAELDGPRMIARSGDFICWAPYWSQVPYEVWIAPIEHDSRSGLFADSPSIDKFAIALADTATRIRLAAGDPALNMIIRDPLPGVTQGPRWHTRIYPRTSTAAGFEIATGIRILTLPPEAAADELRACL